MAIQLNGGPCRLLSAHQRVWVDRTGLDTYPDLLIVGGPPRYAAEDRNSLTNPSIVIEILSDSTERHDRTTKFRHFKQLPSMMEYVLVAQDEPVIERFARLPDGSWAQADFVGYNAALMLTTVPASVPLSDVYLGVEFPSPSRPAGP